MSADATGWVYRHSPATDATFDVHLAVADSCNDQNDNRFWMRLGVLAVKARKSRGTCQRAMRWLVDNGLLEQVTEDPQRTGSAVEYRFLFPEAMPVVYESRSSTTSVTTREGVAHGGVPPSRTTREGSRTTRDITQENPRVEPKVEVEPLLVVPTAPEPGSDADPSFVAFWSSYPRKVDKGGARKAWRAAIKKAAPDTIVEGAQRFARDPNLPPPTYIAHPSTWLNGERWADGPLPSRTGGTARSQSTSNSEAILRRIGEQREARG